MEEDGKSEAAGEGRKEGVPAVGAAVAWVRVQEEQGGSQGGQEGAGQGRGNKRRSRPLGSNRNAA